MSISHFVDTMFLLLLDKYLWEEWLGHVVGISLTLWESRRLISKSMTYEILRCSKSLLTTVTLNFSLDQCEVVTHVIIICSSIMATHSSTRAWKIPWMEEPRRLQSMGLQRVRHDWKTSKINSMLMKLRIFPCA